MGRVFRKAEALALGTCALFFMIQASFGQTFTVTASPSQLTIYPGQQSVPVTVTVGSSTYTGPISITLTGLPSGITVSPLTLTAGATGNLNLSASVSAGQEGFPPSGPSWNTSWTAQTTVVAAAGSTTATSSLSLTISISNPSFAPASSAINLPIVKIDTGGVGIYDKTTDVPGTITITSEDGQSSYLPNSRDSDNTATFHLHGNSTTDMPKLAYHVKLNTSLDLLTTMGLSCPYLTGTKAKPICDKSKSYILLANYDDKTLLRDWAASALANAIPMGNGYLSSPASSPTPSGTSTLMPWAPNSLFVELYLNGVYEGNYQLIEQIKVDSHRVNISALTEADTTDDFTGGYLMEIDEHQDEAFVFTTPQGVPIGLIDPDFTPDAEVSQQTSYISAYVDAAETALYSDNFTDPAQGWRAYFDEASAVNWYLVNELMGNVDGGAFYSSDYLYKAKDNSLLYMGPIWDFDISAGNVNYQPIVNPTVPWGQQNAWYSRWFQDAGFKADVVTQWNALKNNGVLSTWITSIQQHAQSLEQSQANNFSRWPMLGIEVWPNSEAAGTYDGEVQYLTNWLQLRLAYLDSLFNNKAQTQTAFSPGTGSLRSGTPVTLTAQVTGGTTPSGVVSFLSNDVLLGTGSLSKGTATLTTNNLAAGADSIQAVYNGDQVNGLSASTPQSVTVAAPLAATVVSIAGPSTAALGALASFTAAVIPNAGTAAPTGTVTFSLDGGAGTAEKLSGTSLASGYSTPSLVAGTHSVTALYSGDSNYAIATNTANLSVSQATPTVQLTSLSSITTAQDLSVKVAVSGGSGTPVATGTVILTSGSYTAAAQVLSAGSTSIDVPAGSLELGTDTLTASYSGDANYTVKTNTAQVNVTTPPAPGFQLTGIAATVSPGATTGNTSTITVTPIGSFTGSVTLTEAITSSPTGAENPPTLSFGSTSSVAITGASAGTATLTISTTPTTRGALSSPIQREVPWRAGGGAVLACVLLFAIPARRRRWRAVVGMFVLLALLTSGVVSCGGSETSIPGTTAGTYKVTVTGTSGTTTAQTSVSIQVL